MNKFEGWGGTTDGGEGEYDKTNQVHLNKINDKLAHKVLIMEISIEIQNFILK